MANLDPLQFFKKKKKPAAQAPAPTMAANQFTDAAGGAQQNLDPGKMSGPSDTPNVDRMAGYYPPMSARQQTQESQADKDDFDFAQRGEQLQRRASGERSSAETAVENQEGAQLRGQMQASAQQSLASRGFAPSSALGLSYEKDVDRQVSELMERRRAQREQGAMQDLNTYYAQQGQRRQTQVGDRVQQQQLGQQRLQGDRQQSQYLDEMAFQQRQFEAQQKKIKQDRKDANSPLGYLERFVGAGKKVAETAQAFNTPYRAPGRG